MQFSVHQRSDGAVLDVSGRLVHGEPVRDLYEGVRRLAAQGVGEVVINLSEASKLDSVGLEAHVASYVACKRSGANLRVVNANSKARKALRITKLDLLFDVSGFN